MIRERKKIEVFSEEERHPSGRAADLSKLDPEVAARLMGKAVEVCPLCNKPISAPFKIMGGEKIHLSCIGG